MAKPTSTLWEIEPHTNAKHEILRRYLGAWFAILGSKYQKIVYIDGFCGPGRYKGGQDGSPIIALKEANKQSALKNSSVYFLFVDERKDRIDHLNSELASLSVPANFILETKNDEFENVLTNLPDRLKQKGFLSAPTFIFIDPFGFKGAPFSLVQNLLQNPSTEIIITIMVNYVNRFVQHPEPDIQQHIKDLLGATDDEINQILNSEDHFLAFRQLYESKLSQKAKFVGFFEMRDSQNQPIYYLFFASNHPLGFERIKEAFWRVDQQSGYRFSDLTNPDQPTLFEIDPSIELAKKLKEKYSGTIQLSETIITEVENGPTYTTSHAKKALIQLEKNNQIVVNPTKTDGKKRIKSKFPNGVIIQF
jgi:three-Cys-motif partner protein